MENYSDQERDTREENSAAVSTASLKSQIEALQADMQTSQKQNTSLKIMLFSGFIILMLGFFYSSGMFQRSQEKNLETSFYDMRNRVNHELLVIQKKLQLKFQAEEEKINLYFDREMLEQALCNLLLNAVKFTPPGGELRLPSM